MGGLSEAKQLRSHTQNPQTHLEDFCLGGQRSLTLHHTPLLFRVALHLPSYPGNFQATPRSLKPLKPRGSLCHTHSRALSLSHSHTHTNSLALSQATVGQPRNRGRHVRAALGADREFFIDNLLVRIHFIIVMIRWTGLAPGSLTSTFLFRQLSGNPAIVVGTPGRLWELIESSQSLTLDLNP